MVPPKLPSAWPETPVSLMLPDPLGPLPKSCHSPFPRPLAVSLLTPSPLSRILFWTDWDASLPRIEAASMSGAGRRTIHRETGSGGWPNGLTVDYLEKRILWIDARSAPLPPLGGLRLPLPSRARVGRGPRT